MAHLPSAVLIEFTRSESRLQQPKHVRLAQTRYCPLLDIIVALVLKRFIRDDNVFPRLFVLCSTRLIVVEFELVSCREHVLEQARSWCGRARGLVNIFLRNSARDMKSFDVLVDRICRTHSISRT